MVSFWTTWHRWELRNTIPTCQIPESSAWRLLLDHWPISHPISVYLVPLLFNIYMKLLGDGCPGFWNVVCGTTVPRFIFIGEQTVYTAYWLYTEWNVDQTNNDCNWVRICTLMQFNLWTVRWVQIFRVREIPYWNHLGSLCWPSPSTHNKGSVCKEGTEPRSPI